MLSTARLSKLLGSLQVLTDEVVLFFPVRFHSFTRKCVIKEMYPEITLPAARSIQCLYPEVDKIMQYLFRTNAG